MRDDYNPVRIGGDEPEDETEAGGEGQTKPPKENQ